MTTIPASIIVDFIIHGTVAVYVVYIGMVLIVAGFFGFCVSEFVHVRQKAASTGNTIVSISYHRDNRDHTLNTMSQNVDGVDISENIENTSLSENIEDINENIDNTDKSMSDVDTGVTDDILPLVNIIEIDTPSRSQSQHLRDQKILSKLAYYVI